MTKSVLHIAPLIEPLTDKAPGGAEKLLMALAAEQARKGVKVSVVATVGSQLPPGVTLVSLGIQPREIIPIETGSPELLLQLTAEEINTRIDIERRVFSPVFNYLRNNRNSFDIVHNHSYDSVPLFELEQCGVSIIHTLHLPPMIPWINQRLSVERERHGCYFTISHANARAYQDQTGFLPGVIYNGLDLKKILFVDQPGNHFIWVGRISPEKGLHTAIHLVVNQLKQQLVVIGRIYDQAYYEREIAPLIKHPLVRYLGFRPHNEVVREMGRAKAFIFPLTWDEPFGLTVVEALAAGTPVVTFRRGAMEELVIDGTTGFLLREVSEFQPALKRLDTLSRKNCRASVEKRFSVETMVEQYHLAYQTVSPNFSQR